MIRLAVTRYAFWLVRHFGLLGCWYTDPTGARWYVEHPQQPNPRVRTWHA